MRYCTCIHDEMSSFTVPLSLIVEPTFRSPCHEQLYNCITISTVQRTKCHTYNNMACNKMVNYLTMVPAGITRQVQVDINRNCHSSSCDNYKPQCFVEELLPLANQELGEN